jgi:hypothetical protein
METKVLSFKTRSELYGTTDAVITDIDHAIKSGFCPCGSGEDYKFSSEEIEQLKQIKSGSLEEFTPELRVQTTKEHFETYRDLFVAKGSPLSLISVIESRIGKAAIVEALTNGAGHLNEIPLKVWDGLCQHVGWTGKQGDKFTKSNSQQVCLLKHIATYQIAKAKPVFKG